MSIQVWATKSQLPGDSVTAGAFENAMRVSPMYICIDTHSDIIFQTPLFEPLPESCMYVAVFVLP